MKFVGFSVRKPKPFNYKPRYYDEKKERIEELKKKYNGEKEEGGVSPDFKEKLRASWHIKEKRIGTVSKGTMLIYLVIVVLFIYFIFFR
ncbi:MAG TPA: hypothetical protein VK212_07365 [Lentimicrobium sp.]|nr:hypothetical protein [Lentimicrobium sp.]